MLKINIRSCWKEIICFEHAIFVNVGMVFWLPWLHEFELFICKFAFGVDTGTG